MLHGTVHCINRYTLTYPAYRVSAVNRDIPLQSSTEKLSICRFRPIQLAKLQKTELCHKYNFSTAVDSSGHQKLRYPQCFSR